MQTFFIIASVASILGFFFGVAATQWGRGILLDISRNIHVPFLGVKLVRLGIYDFFDSRTSLAQTRGSTRIIDYLSLAKKEVGIIAISLNYSIMHQHLHNDLRTLIKSNPEINIFVFLLNAESSVLDSVATATGRTVDELKQYIQQSLSRLTEMVQGLDVAERQRFHLRLYETYVANSILVVDPHEADGRFLVENYLYKVPIHGRYSFECKRPDSPMYSKLLVAYEEFKKDFG